MLVSDSGIDTVTVVLENSPREKHLGIRLKYPILGLGSVRAKASYVFSEIMGITIVLKINTGRNRPGYDRMDAQFDSMECCNG